MTLALQSYALFLCLHYDHENRTLYLAGKIEHCFIESVQFFVPAQGGGVLLWQPEEVKQKKEIEQE